MDSFRLDVCYAVRALGRRPGFALEVPPAPAPGIGASKAIFSVVRSVLLRPPYEERGRESSALLRLADRNGLDVRSISMGTGRSWAASQRANTRFYLVLRAAFAGLALTLAATGIHGVAAFIAAGRSRAIGLRMVLGARIRQVVALVVWQGSGAGLMGLAVGVAGAVATGRVMAGLLFDVKPHDPVTFAGVTLVLLAVVGLACIVPASRAGGFHPQRRCAPIRRRARSLGGSL